MQVTKKIILVVYLKLELVVVQCKMTLDLKCILPITYITDSDTKIFTNVYGYIYFISVASDEGCNTGETS